MGWESLHTDAAVAPGSGALAFAELGEGQRLGQAGAGKGNEKEGCDLHGVWCRTVVSLMVGDNVFWC